MRTCRTSAKLAVILAAFILPVTTHGQWLNYKAPGIPRTADGKPDLAAPGQKRLMAGLTCLESGGPMPADTA